VHPATSLLQQLILLWHASDEQGPTRVSPLAVLHRARLFISRWCRLLLDLYRDLHPPLLHSGHLRTILIRVAAVRAHALQLIQGYADLQIVQDACASTPRTSPDPRPVGRA
jgi:hypothetical protein